LLGAFQYLALFRHIKRAKHEPDYAVVQNWMLLFCCQKKVWRGWIMEVSLNSLWNT